MQGFLFKLINMTTEQQIESLITENQELQEKVEQLQFELKAADSDYHYKTKELQEIVEEKDKELFNIKIESSHEIADLVKENQQLQSRISELENPKQVDGEIEAVDEMVKYILGIDALTTTEFCNKYNVPKPVFTGEVNSSVNEMLRIDAVKHRMFVQKAKEIFKNRK